jgi:phosphate transport system substrate-binding protein
MTNHRLATSPRSRSRRRTRTAILAAALGLSTLGLAACGSDPVPTGTAEQSGNAPAGLTCPSGRLTAEGSSAQANAITEIIASYNEVCGSGAQIEYNPTGSGAGIKSFYNGLVDFAGSDSALKSEEKDGVVESEKAAERCGGNPAWNLPMVVGPIAFVYNLEGVDNLTLNAQVIAQIFDGTIKTWNDPKIAKLNEGVTLPSDSITVFFRSDESGTTENTTKYLKAAGEGAWKSEPSKAWTGVGEGKNKSSGIAEAVTATANSVSYVEWSYAKDNNLATAALDSGSGATPLSAEAVASAVSAAKITGKGNDLSLSLKYDGLEQGAYPALLVTYEIVCSKGLDAEKTALVKDFLTYFASSEGQGQLEDLGYAPLPGDLRTKVETAIEAIS